MDSLKNSEHHHIFLGHCQAPTSSERKYSAKTSHPFSAGNWHVAHNGVLQNFKELKSKYFSNGYHNPVDSSIIPAMLEDIDDTLENVSEIKAVKTALNRLKGTFAVWIYNSKSGNVFLARQGAPIFVNFRMKAFSSVNGQGFEEIPEGVVFRFSELGVTEVEQFNAKPPFLVLDGEPA